MPWPDAFPRPTVTILLPIERHRGVLPRAIEAWSLQNYPRELLEFVFVSNTREPKIAAYVEQRLKKPGALRGSIVHIRTTNEMAQYVYGARYARGEWLLFTEAHCVPQFDCVSELIGALLARGLTGGCVRTLSDPSTNRYAQLAERVYQDDFALWSHDGDWRKFTKRGFALRRDVYRSIGGLEDQFGWFSELVISARLAAGGHRLGYVPSAAVQHFNSTTIAELMQYVWDYHYELARYADIGSATLRPYLQGLAACEPPAPPVVVQATRSAVRAVLAGALWRTYAPSGRRLALALIGKQLEAACGRTWKLASRAALARLRMQFCSWNAEQLYCNYLGVAASLAEWGLAAYAPRAVSHTPAATIADGRLEIFPGEIDAGLYGFHVGERYAGRKFRWTKPVASVTYDAPVEDYDVTLDAGGIVDPQSELHLFCNGQRVQRGEGLRFHIRRETLADDGPQVLTLIVPPRPSRDPRETRSLGLPLFTVQITKAARQSLRIAA